MAKKAVKKIAKKARKAKKAKAAAPTPVHIQAKTLEKLEKAARKAGLSKRFKSAVGKTRKTVFVHVDRENFDKLKELVQHEKLAAHPTAQSLSNCDCDPDDIFCFC